MPAAVETPEMLRAAIRDGGAPLSTAAKQSLSKWLLMFASGDLHDLPSIVASDAVFHSPVGLKPYRGREVVCLVLRTAASIFENFEYGHVSSGDGRALLLFAAHIGDAQLRGVHSIQFNDAGEVRDVEKMIRPSKAAVLLGNAIGDKAGERIRALRDGDDE